MFGSTPEVAALMKPKGDVVFAQSERVDLLWALELLAWNPAWLDRVVGLLAKLAEIEPDDNLANKPSGSLKSIFRSWMPQTGTPLAHRIAVFDRLVEKTSECCMEHRDFSISGGLVNGWPTAKSPTGGTTRRVSASRLA